MADIARYPLLRHLRSEPTEHVLRYTAGRLRAEGPGLAFWFRPIDTAVAEVPIDDRELPFLFRVRSADFQELTVQGVITLPRRRAAQRLAQRDRLHARPRDRPLGAGARSSRSPGCSPSSRSSSSIDELGRLDLAGDPRRRRGARSATASSRLADEPALAELGLADRRRPRRRRRARPPRWRRRCASRPARRSSSRPTRPRSSAARSRSRRSARSRRTSSQPHRARPAARSSSSHSRRQAAKEQAAAKSPQADDERARLQAAAQGRRDRRRGGARKLRAERERAEIQSAMPPEVLRALALRQLAGQLGQIDHLTVTPDLVAPAAERANGRRDWSPAPSWSSARASTPSCSPATPRASRCGSSSSAAAASWTRCSERHEQLTASTTAPCSAPSRADWRTATVARDELDRFLFEPRGRRRSRSGRTGWSPTSPSTSTASR